MDTFEEDITNEKDLISKDDIEKSNSLAIKSLDETGFDFIELLNEKYILFITLKKLNNTPIQITNKSILKIFKLFCDKDNKENLEENLLNHITCTIAENNDFITINPVVDNSIGIDILDAPYAQKCSLFYKDCTFSKSFHIKNCSSSTLLRFYNCDFFFFFIFGSVNFLVKLYLICQII